MDVFLPNIWLYGACLLATTFLIAGVGLLVMKWMPEWRERDNAFLTILNALAIGLTMVVPLFAVVWAKGNSIMWIAVLLWVFYIVRRNKKPLPSETGKARLDWTAVLLAVALLVGVYALFYWLFFVRSGGSLCGDYVYYANVSCLMLDEHVETARFQSLFRFPVPYHYGDTWFTSLLSLLFGQKPIYVLHLLAYPFFFFMIVVGVAAMCLEVSRINKLVALAIGLIIMFYKPLVSLVIPWQYTLFPVPKIYIVTAFVVWCSLMLVKGDFRRAFVAVCFLVPFYSTVSAGVLSFVFLTAIGLEWHRTRSWKCLWNEYSIAALAIALSFFVFYMVQEKSPVEGPELVFDKGMAVNAVLYAARWTLKSCILLLPSFVAMLYLGKKDPARWGKGWIVVAAVALSCAVTIFIGGALQQVNRDGIQVMTNYVDTARIVCCYVVLLLLLGTIPKRLRTTCRVGCCLFVIYPLCFYADGVKGSWFWPSHDMYADIGTLSLDKLKGQDALFGVFRVFDVDRPIQYFAIDDFDMVPHFLKSGYYCHYELSELELPDDFPAINNDSHHHAFVEYVTLQKRDGKFVSNEQSMLDFVRFMGIGYLIVEPGAALPAVFEDKVTLVAKRGETVMYRVNSKS